MTGTIAVCDGIGDAGIDGNGWLRFDSAPRDGAELLVVAGAQPGGAAPISAAPLAIGCTSTTAVTAGAGGADWVPLVQQGLAWLCGHVGPLNPPVEVSIGPSRRGGVWPFAAVSPVGTAAGSLSSCPITIETLAGVSDSNARMATITHELWHCYEAQIMGVGPFTNQSNAHPLTGESDRQEPGLCILGVQGNALVEVLAHPDAAPALYAMTMQNTGDAPTTCEQLSAGSPEPLLGSGARPPAKADGAVGSLQCAYEPNYPQSHYKDVAMVVWFGSATQAEQAYSQAEQFLERRGAPAP